MSKSRLLGRLSTLALITALPLTAAAEGGYFGAGAGYSDSGINGQEDSASARVHGGILYWGDYGLEVGYMNFGDMDPENGNGNRLEASGAYLALAGFNRISEVVELTGKLGAFHWNQEQTRGGSTVSETDGTSAIFAIGANFYLTDAVALGLEVSHVDDIEDDGMTSLWVQIQVNIGRN